MKVSLIFLAALFFWPFGSSGTKFEMVNANAVPAAHGLVQAKRDKPNGNTRLDVKVWNLANPATLTPSENTYILWVELRDGAVEKEGEIHVGKDEKGETVATTTSRDCDVFVTAEQSESVAMPTGPQVLHVHVSV